MAENKKQFITTENVPDFSVTVYDSAEKKWTDIIKENLKTPFDIYKGPLIRFFLIKDFNETEIIAVFHHGICDGVAAVQFLHDVFNFLSNPGLAVIENNRSMTLLDAVKDDIKDIVFKRPLPDWLEESRKNETDENILNKKIEYPDPDFEMHFWSMGEKDLQCLLDYTRKKSLSINSIIAAVFLRAFSCEFGEKEGYIRTVQCPVDFRIYLKEEAKLHAGLFNGLIKTQIDCNPERSIDDMAEDIKKDIKEKIESYIPLDGYLFFMRDYLAGIDDPEKFIRMHNSDDPMDYDFSLSNLGVIKLEKNYGEYEIKEIAGPIFSAVRGERVIGVLTHGNQLF